MEFLDGSWKKEVSSWDALMGEELLNQEAILEGAIHSIRLSLIHISEPTRP